MKHMRWVAALVAAVLSVLVAAVPSAAHESRFRVLVFSKTTFFSHDSIAAGVSAIEKMGTDHDFEVESTIDAAAFTDENLARFDVIVFNNTNSNETSPALLDANQRAAFQKFIRGGGGWTGLHAATASERNWDWYAGLVGTIFDFHGDYNATGGTGPGRIKVLDRAHPSTKNLPELWERNEEWYNWRTNPTGNVHTLAQIKVRDGDNKLDEGVDHAYSWCQNYDGGRSWYTAGGHSASAFGEPAFLEHLRYGIEWAAGAVEGDCSPTKKSSYTRVPLVTDGLSDPFELAVAPDKRVFYIERTGALKVIDQTTLAVSTLLDFDYTAEQTSQSGGLIGLTLDKDFATNKWLYVLWSDKTESRLNLSRFTVSNNSVALSSEKRLLTIPVFAPSGSRAASHLGGSLTMDKSGNLYAGIGDNTDPFQSSGYTPIDERADRAAYDAQATSGNTNDLRGKILRIKPQADGTYTIPSGNLFAAGTAKTKPEIYAMGFRNPFRITVDSQTNAVLVGDYGPDARSANATRGPEGTVEFDRITSAGNYGWPYCVGNNTAFNDYDFATNTAGAKFNCAAPVNDSPNNTGLQNLPASKPALVSYAYSASAEFPELGTGGGGPMSGPVYDYDAANTNPNKFPEYFDGKWITYELTRQWFKTLSIHKTAQTFTNSKFAPTKAGDLQSINGIFGDMTWTQPFEAEFGPDGALYVIDFGEGSGSGRGGSNEGSGIYRIDYTPNGPAPVANIAADKDSGKAPLTVAFSSSGSTGTNLTYKWDFDNNGTVDSTVANPTFTYGTTGKKTAKLTVTNTAGSNSGLKDIVVGNTRPTVKINIPDGGVYEWGDRIPYTVTVTDPEEGTIDCSRVTVQTKLGHDSHAHPLDTYTGCSGTLLTDPSGADGHGEGQNLYAVVSAQYTDGGALNGTVPALSGATEVELRPRFMEAEHFDATSGAVNLNRTTAHGGVRVGDLDHGDWIKFSPQNLQLINSVTLGASSGAAGATVEFRADSPTGQLLGSVGIPNTGSYDTLVSPTVALTNPNRTFDLYLVVNNPNATGDLLSLDWLRFNGRGVKQESGAGGTATATASTTTARTMNFSATVTPPPGRTIVDKVWSFGDNSADVHSYSTTHTYAAPGTYTAWLTVTDSAGAKHSFTRPFTIT
ncbi:ThuA domain-containing protein [Streptomyces sp. NPDC002812]|uniref:ThuA domain-containing protein n=1 Tax=Streptomyces sp. NPDC002812 TaxID=3154434 RepID=UPI003326B07C